MASSHTLLLKKKLLICSVLIFLHSAVHSQSMEKWYLSAPSNFMVEQRMDTIINYEASHLAPVAANYAGSMYMAWSKEDRTGVQVRLVEQFDIAGNKPAEQAAYLPVNLGNTGSQWTPCLAYSAGRLFLFARSYSGRNMFYYSIGKPGQSFEKAEPRVLQLPAGAGGFTDPEGGLFVCEYEQPKDQDAGKLFLIWKEGNALYYAIGVTNAQREIKISKVSKMNETSIACPSATYIKNAKVAIAWTGTDASHQLNAVLYDNGTFRSKKTYSDRSSGATPVIYKKWGTSGLRLLWKGSGNDRRIWNSYLNEETLAAAEQRLLREDDDISTAAAPAIIHKDNNSFAIIYPHPVGSDDKHIWMLKDKNNSPGYKGKYLFKISYATTYSYEKWMEQTVYDHTPFGKIALPGAHDAAMYGVKDCTFGANECNTVTQTYPVRELMNKGIRYFDLRPSETKGGDMYAGHYANWNGFGAKEMSFGCNGKQSLNQILKDVKEFLTKNNKEIIIINISHIGIRYITDGAVNGLRLTADSVLRFLKNNFPANMVYQRTGNTLTSLNDLSATAVAALRGKLLITSDDGTLNGDNWVWKDVFENNDNSEYRRYADTQNGESMLKAEEEFVKRTDRKYSRLDWQVSLQGTYDNISCATSVKHCLDGVSFSIYQWYKTVYNCAAAVVTFTGNSIYKVFSGEYQFIFSPKSILYIAAAANSQLEKKIAEWVKKGYISKARPVNIIYMDIADNWVTDICVDLNVLYQK